MERGFAIDAPAVSPRRAGPGSDADFPKRINRATGDKRSTWRVVSPLDLTETECSAWWQIQAETPALASPFLSPEFTLAVAARHPDVRVAILESSGQIAAFFPFHKQRHIGKPIGRHLSDFQALIASPLIPIDVQTLLRACGLDIWEFQNLLPLHATLENYAIHKSVSPFIDLRQGYEAYVAERRKAGTEHIKKTENLARRLQKDVGPLRFQYHNPDPALFTTLIDWRNRDLRAHNWSDGFQPSTIDLFERIYARKDPHFAGVLSTLHAGDRLAAVHFGMRTATRLHYWVPSYEPELAKCSPGIILLLRIAEAAAQAGIQQVDLGPGNHEYKTRLASDHTLMISGYLHRPSFTAAVRVLRTNTTSLLRKVSLDVPAKRLANWLHHS